MQNKTLWVQGWKMLGLGCLMMLVWSAPGDAEAAGNDNKLWDIEKLVSVSENTRGALDKAHRKLDAAVKAMAALQSAGPDDAKSAYGKFKNAADEFRKQANEAEKKIYNAEQESQVFFSKWQQNIAVMTDDKRRTRAERRRAASELAFQRHVSAFKEVDGIFAPAITELSQQVAFLKDNYGARTAPSVSDSYARVVKLADDIFWQVDNAIAKTEVLK